MVLASVAYGAFPTQLNTATNDISQIRGGFSDFNWTWIAENDQSIQIDFTNNGAAPLVLDAYSQGARLSKDGTMYVDIRPPSITSVNDRVTFTISRTNIPPNATYDFEIWTYTGATTNNARTIAQGTVNVRKSLYSNTNAFPFPNWSTNDLTSYMLVSDYDTTDNDIVDTSDAFIDYTNSGPLSGLQTTQALHTAEIAGLTTTQAWVVTSLSSVSNDLDTAEATLSTNVMKLNAFNTLVESNSFSDVYFGANGSFITGAGTLEWKSPNENTAIYVSDTAHELKGTNGDVIAFTEGYIPLGDLAGAGAVIPTWDLNAGTNLADGALSTNVVLEPQNNTYASGTTQDFTSADVVIAASTSSNNPVTRHELDLAAGAAGAQNWYFNTNPSPYLATFESASNQPSTDATTTNVFTDVTNTQELVRWAFLPKLEAIAGGTYTLNIHDVNPSPSGDKDLGIYFVLGFSNLAGGASFQVSTSEVGRVTTASEEHEQIHDAITDINADLWPGTGGVFMVHVFASCPGAGNPPEINLLYQGPTDSGLAFGAPVSGNYIPVVDIGSAVQAWDADLDTFAADPANDSWTTNTTLNIGGQTNTYWQVRLHDAAVSTNFALITFSGTNFIFKSNASTNEVRLGIPSGT